VVSLGNTLVKHLRDVPALSIVGLACISAAAAIAFGIAACLLVVGVSLILVEMVVAK
jgi:hypothetical protein